MRHTKSKGECEHCHHRSEDKIFIQIENTLKKMHIPEKIMIQINEELKKSSNIEHANQMKEIEKLNTQYQTLQTRMKRARDLLLDTSFQSQNTMKCLLL